MYSDEVQPYLDIYYNSLDKSKIRELIQHATDGGKCVRGFIVKHIIETLTGKTPAEIPWQPIASVELIHSASIVIDDLPCMDNDTYRRGKLSTFKHFGNNEAILSSYFMISETLRIIIDGLDDSDNLRNLKTLMNEWCELLGKNLVVGQFLDLKGDAESYFNIKFSKNDSVNDYIIKYKTCSLFSFSFLIGAFFSNKTDPDSIQDFKDMGLHFGMMFQLMDDYRDKDTDVPYANYVLTKGLPKSIEKYKESRDNLSLLLKKHNLYTDKFVTLMLNIDKLFVN
jgi:geranylgeranyl diphosphate synthase, type II